jgi:uncharacterized protein (DUF1697 family)
MKTFISLLRGINVSGQNKIRMPELKGLYKSLNLTNVVTYIQSGNVIFDCAEQDPTSLARSIEAAIARSFGSSVRVFLRDKNRFQQIIDSNPFYNQRDENPEKLHVTFLSDLPSESAKDLLQKSAKFYTGDSPAVKGRASPAGMIWEPGPQIYSLRSGAGNADEFLIYDQEIYLFCPNGYGRTKLSNNFFERKLSVSATTRNWKTVKALFEIANQR